MDLGKPVAGIPMAVWGGVVVLGLGVGYYINKKQASTPDQSLQTEAGVGKGGSGFDVVEPPPPTPPVTIDTNMAWGRQAVNWLVSTGQDPGIADNALRKYLASENLTLQEQALVNLCIVKFGAPPEPLAPVTVPQPIPQPPAAVENIVVTGRGPYWLSIAWTPVFGASSYLVKVKSRLGEWNEVKTLLPTFDTKAHGTLTSGENHTLTVWAVNAQGRSEPAEIQATPSGGGSSPTPTPPSPTPTPTPPAQRRYTVISGDMLTSIALKHGMAASRWREIYNANSGPIEAAARAHGRSTSSGGPRNEPGWYIYPGTTLTIP